MSEENAMRVPRKKIPFETQKMSNESQLCNENLSSSSYLFCISYGGLLTATK